jgi:hypothetical protein
VNIFEQHKAKWREYYQLKREVDTGKSREYNKLDRLYQEAEAIGDTIQWHFGMLTERGAN